ncbi:hypothetical protein M8818_005098 [Zalaria obscura]|uniref:Uncharacterized protein n=1 Tax=Zalaria obscura TaxID=2024903 RepID=A0ACC3SE57_9PEZI
MYVCKLFAQAGCCQVSRIPNEEVEVTGAGGEIRRHDVIWDQGRGDAKPGQVASHREKEAARITWPSPPAFLPFRPIPQDHRESRSGAW